MPTTADRSAVPTVVAGLVEWSQGWGSTLASGIVLLIAGVAGIVVGLRSRSAHTLQLRRLA